MGFSEIFHNRLMADRFVLETSKGSVGYSLPPPITAVEVQRRAGRGVRGCDLQKREKELLRRAHPPQQEHQGRRYCRRYRAFLSLSPFKTPRLPSASLGKRFLPEASSRNSRLIGDKAYDSDALDEKLASEMASS